MYHSTIDLLNNPMIYTAIKTATTQTMNAKDFFGISRPSIQSPRAGVVIVQGLEAGGHRGLFLSTDITTHVSSLALTSQIISA